MRPCSSRICPSCFGFRWVVTTWGYALRSLGRLTIGRALAPLKQPAELPRERESVDVVVLCLGLVRGLDPGSGARLRVRARPLVRLVDRLEGGVRGCPRVPNRPRARGRA